MAWLRLPLKYYDPVDLDYARAGMTEIHEDAALMPIVAGATVGRAMRGVMSLTIWLSAYHSLGFREASPTALLDGTSDASTAARTWFFGSGVISPARIEVTGRKRHRGKHGSGTDRLRP